MDISQLPKDMRKLQKQIGDTRPLMKDIAQTFIEMTQKKWEIRGGGESYQGVKWPELAEATTKQKRADRPGGIRGDAHILIDYGGMHAGLTYDYDEKEAKIYFQSHVAQLYFWHHFGMGRLPERIVLDITKEDEKKLNKEANRFVKEALEFRR